MPLGGWPVFLVANVPLSLSAERWTSQWATGKGVDSVTAVQWKSTQTSSYTSKMKYKVSIWQESEWTKPIPKTVLKKSHSDESHGTNLLKICLRENTERLIQSLASHFVLCQSGRPPDPRKQTLRYFLRSVLADSRTQRLETAVKRSDFKSKQPCRIGSHQAEIMWSNVAGSVDKLIYSCLGNTAFILKLLQD